MSKKQIIVSAIFATVAWSAPSFAAPLQTYTVTPELIAAATKEGAVTYYGSVDLQVVAKLKAAFEAKYPGIKFDGERAGSERIFQRLEQENQSGIHNDDVIETSDGSHFLTFEDQKLLIQDEPEDVAKYWPAHARDPNGMYAAYRSTLTVMAYRNDLVKPADAPATWTDLLKPQYKGMIVKAHPAYSGNVMTATYALSQLLGWSYYQKLSQQNVMQVQSSTEPPKILAQGERAIQADGNEYVDFIQIDKGAPITIVYPAVGTSIAFNNAAILASAPHPNAAKLLYAFLFSEQAQQESVALGGRTWRPDVKEPANRTPLSKIHLIFSNPAKVRAAVPEIKQHYAEYFGT